MKPIKDHKKAKNFWVYLTVEMQDYQLGAAHLVLGHKSKDFKVLTLDYLLIMKKLKKPY